MDLREKALSCAPREELVDVPEWGGQVLVREMDGEERFRWETKCGEGENSRVVAVIECARDPETGAHLFKEDDAEALAKTACGPIVKISNAILRLSGISSDEIEEEEKN